MSNKYWEAREQAVLSREQVDGDWADDDSALALCNRAFCLYHRTMRNARAMEATDSEQSTKIKREIRDAATTGYGPGGNDDLYEAFQHMAANDGRMKYSYVEPYMGAQQTPLHGMVHEVPKSICNFLGAVDSRMETLKPAASQFKAKADRLYHDIEKPKRWKQVGDSLGSIGKISGRVDRYLWLAPPTRTVLKIGDVAGKVSTYADVVGAIYDGADTAVQMSRHLDVEEAAAVGAIRTAVSFVPVVGSMLSEAVAAAPDVIDAFKNFDHAMEKYHATRLNPERALSRRSRGSDRKTCQRCNCKMKEPCA